MKKDGDFQIYVGSRRKRIFCVNGTPYICYYFILRMHNEVASYCLILKWVAQELSASLFDFPIPDNSSKTLC